MKSNRIYIVFGEEHYNPLGIIRSLGRKHIKCVAIIKKNVFRLASKSKYISKLHLVDSIQEGYDVLLSEYGNEKNKPIVFTSDDQITSFLDQRYNEIKNKFIFYNAGKENRIGFFMEKDNLNELAVKHGLTIAKSWIVKPGDIPRDIKYPIITKAIISTIDNWKDDVFICNNKEELMNAYKNIRSKKVILQQFIDKKNELCYDGFSYNKGNNVCFAIASNYINIKKEAYSNYMIVKNAEYPELENKIRSMIKEIGFEGIFSVEFLIDKDDNYYFLEINFRNSTWSWAATKSGINMPYLWSQAMIDNKKDDIPVNKFKPFKAMAELVDFNDRVKTHEISIFNWFFQMLGCKCKYFWDIKDIKPYFSRINYKFRKVIRGQHEN